MTTRLRWHSKLSKKRKAAAVAAAQAAGYPGAKDDGACLAIPHSRADPGPLSIFLEGSRAKLFAGIITSGKTSLREPFHSPD